MTSAGSFSSVFLFPGGLNNQFLGSLGGAVHPLAIRVLNISSEMSSDSLEKRVVDLEGGSLLCLMWPALWMVLAAASVLL